MKIKIRMTEDDSNVTPNTKECNYYLMVGEKEFLTGLESKSITHEPNVNIKGCVQIFLKKAKMARLLSV